MQVRTSSGEGVQLMRWLMIVPSVALAVLSSGGLMAAPTQAAVRLPQTASLVVDGASLTTATPQSAPASADRVLVKVAAPAIPRQTRVEWSRSLYVGQRKLAAKGADGVRLEKWLVHTRQDATVYTELVSSQVAKPAKPRVWLVGTKKKPTPAKAPGAGLSPATQNTCRASFYHEPQMTASGERFNPNAMTAAHKTLPLGTRIKVTNPSTHRTVVVRINDRGPYVGGRCLDLSRAAMQAVGGINAGVVTVKWEKV